MSLPSPQTTTFRDTYEAMIPRWMKQGRLWRVGYSVALHLDLLGDAVAASVRIGFPGGYWSGANERIGLDRKIVRGYDEPDASYEAALRNWRDIHARKGNPWVMLERLRAYFTGHDVTLDLIQNIDGTTASYRTIYVDGTREAGTMTWNWDANVGTYTSRFWIIITVPEDVATAAPTWGDGGWNVNETVGSSAPYSMVESVRSIVEAFRPRASNCDRIIVVFNQDDWAAQPPDGTWNRASHRNPNACYWRGTDPP
jgi:hypothetical protein